jgi:hypothetical protein
MIKSFRRRSVRALKGVSKFGKSSIMGNNSKVKV